MKVFVILSALLAVTTAGYIANPIVGVIASQYHAQDELGQYNYGYNNPLSSKVEIKTADGITQGGYNYFDAEGKYQSVQYTSDTLNGFRVAATNLPQAPLIQPLPASLPVQDTPEVSAAKARHFQAVKAVAEEADAIAERRDSQIAKAPIVAAAAPALAYAYGYPTGQSYSYSAYNHLAVPAVAAYAAPYVPADTPEVAQAKAEHLAAHAAARARSL